MRPVGAGHPQVGVTTPSGCCRHRVSRVISFLRDKHHELARRAPHRRPGRGLWKIRCTHAELPGVRTARLDRIDVVATVAALGIVGEQIVGLRIVGAEGVFAEHLIGDRRATSGAPNGPCRDRSRTRTPDRRVGARSAEHNGQHHPDPQRAAQNRVNICNRSVGGQEFGLEQVFT